MLMVSTTGEHSSYYVLDEALKPVETEMPDDLKFSVERIQENCEPALCTVLFMAGAGGSLRAGVTDNPVRLTRSVKDALTRVTSGGAPVYVWPGGGITYMVDVTQMPSGAFGYVPTPGAGRADRVHDEAVRLRRARRAHGLRRSRCPRCRAVTTSASCPGRTRFRDAGHDQAPANRIAVWWPAAAFAGWTD